MGEHRLELVVKVTVLQAIVESNYDVRAAARALGISQTTLYRKLRLWNLTPPMFSPTPKVLRKDFVERCGAIRQALLDAEIKGGKLR